MKPVYRLQELIEAKYGEGERRFALGCQLVAAFLGFANEDEWTSIKVLKMCKATERIEISIDDWYKIKSLFKLKDISELINSDTSLNS